MYNRLPEHVFARKKKGFGIPLATWLRGPFKEPLLQSLNRIKKLGIINTEPIETGIKKHMLKKEDFRNQLWNILVLGEWIKHYGFSDVAEDITSALVDIPGVYHS